MKHFLSLAVAIGLFGVASGESLAAGGQPTHLAELQPWQPPEGARALCRNYAWACEAGARDAAAEDSALLSAAREVNVEVNRRIRPQNDSTLYGVSERWTLPENGRGDCEDYALLKMRQLLDRGVPAERLLLAVVLNDSFAPHVVLVLRTDRADYFLDNMTDLVAPWHETGYAVLTMQSPRDKSLWSAVFMGESLAWNSGGSDAELPWNRQVAEEQPERSGGESARPALGAATRDY